MTEVRCKKCKQPMAPGASCHGHTRTGGMGAPKPRPSGWWYSKCMCGPADVVHTQAKYPCKCGESEITARWGENWADVAWMAQALRTMGESDNPNVVNCFWHDLLDNGIPAYAAEEDWPQ